MVFLHLNLIRFASFTLKNSIFGYFSSKNSIFGQFLIENSVYNHVYIKECFFGHFYTAKRPFCIFSHRKTLFWEVFALKPDIFEFFLLRMLFSRAWSMKIILLT